MNNKSLPIIIGVILVAAVGGLVYVQSKPGQSYTPPVTTGTQDGTATTTSGGTGKTYSMAEVATHKDATSCWTVIDNNVYDLTAWIPQHPGGQQAILSICGIDGTAAFHGQHDDAQRQATILATFKIGSLAQ